MFKEKRFRVLNPAVAEKLTTTGYYLTHYQINPALYHLGSRGISVEAIKKRGGLEKTFLLGEAAGHFRPWGSPFNWRELGTRINADPATYGTPSADGAHFVFCDGAVKFLSAETDAAILKSMAKAYPLPDATALRRPKWDYKYK